MSVLNKIDFPVGCGQICGKPLADWEMQKWTPSPGSSSCTSENCLSRSSPQSCFRVWQKAWVRTTEPTTKQSTHRSSETNRLNEWTTYGSKRWKSGSQSEWVGEVRILGRKHISKLDHFWKKIYMMVRSKSCSNKQMFPSGRVHFRQWRVKANWTILILISLAQECPKLGLEGLPPAAFPNILPEMLLISWIKCVQPIRSFNDRLDGKHAGHRPSTPGFWEPCSNPIQ